MRLDRKSFIATAGGRRAGRTAAAKLEKEIAARRDRLDEIDKSIAELQEAAATVRKQLQEWAGRR